MKQAEGMAKKRELFMLMRRLKKRLFDTEQGSDNKAQRQDAWEEVFRKGKELGLAGNSSNYKQFRKNCVDNTIRRTTAKLMRQNESRQEGGRKVVFDSLDVVVLDVIGRSSEQQIATQEDRGSGTWTQPSGRDGSEPVDKATVREQLKHMGFAVDASPVDTVPVKRVVTVDVTEPADKVIVLDGAVPVDGTAQMNGKKATDAVFPDEDSPTPAIDPPSRPTSSAGDQRRTPTSSAPRPRPCTVSGTRRTPPSSTVPSGSSPNLDTAHRGPRGPNLDTAQRRCRVVFTDGIDRRALAAEYRALLARPDEERTDEERAKVKNILTVRLLERLAGDSNSTASELRRLAALVLATLG